MLQDIITRTIQSTLSLPIKVSKFPARSMARSWNCISRLLRAFALSWISFLESVFFYHKRRNTTRSVQAQLVHALDVVPKKSKSLCCSQEVMISARSWIMWMECPIVGRKAAILAYADGCGSGKSLPSPSQSSPVLNTCGSPSNRLKLVVFPHVHRLARHSYIPRNQRSTVRQSRTER